MLIFETLRWQLKMIGVIPIQEEHLPSNFRALQTPINRAHIIFVWFSMLTFTVSPLLFLFFKATNFTEASEAVFTVSVAVLDLILFSFLIWKRDKCLELVTELENILEIRCRNPRIREIYKRENVKSEKFTRGLMRVAMVCVELYLVPTFLASYHRYYSSDYSEDAFVQLFPAVVPWNWKTPMGYMTLSCFQAFCWANIGMFSSECVLTFFGGFSILFSGFAIDIKESTMDFNKSIIEAKRQENDSHSTGKLIKLMNKLSDIIQFHSDSKDLIERFSTEYRSMIFTFFVLSFVFICTPLLGLNAAIANGKTSDAVRIFFSLVIDMNYISVLCLLGDLVTSNFDEIDISYYTCNWNELPLEMENAFMIMIQVAQQPIYVQGYMNSQCTRGVLKKVINAAFSYFMVLREFS